MKEKPSSRFREIIMVFAKYGFGYIFDRKDEEQATYYLNEGIKLFNESEKIKTNK